MVAFGIGITALALFVITAGVAAVIGTGRTGAASTSAVSATRIVCNLSPDDVSRITNAVWAEIMNRPRSGVGPIKSVEGTNGVVEVWYADKEARWGEAGYRLERSTNGWRITTILFR